MTADFDTYFDYLTGRSRLAYAYRKHWLYRRLARHLVGRSLDIGCGIGDMLRVRPGMVGVDINPRAVEFCKKQGFEAHLMDIDVLPFSNNSFQSAVMDNVLEHIVDPRPILTEARRVLGPGGRLLVGVPGEAGYKADPDHKVFYDRAGLAALMAENGFAMQHCFPMPLPFSGLSKVLRSHCIYSVNVSSKV